MRKLLIAFSLFFFFASAEQADARIEVCNQTDLVLMVVVGYDTAEDRTATEGWWRIYPGMCEVPVDVAFLKGSYFVHAESNPRSTMPDDAFSWGDGTPLCVKLNDFRLPNGKQCGEEDLAVSFNKINKNWDNVNVVDIYHPERSYENQFRTKIAGIQRLLSIIGYDVGSIDGVVGEKTGLALNEIASQNKVFGFDFDQVFLILEHVIAERQKLDN